MREIALNDAIDGYVHNKTQSEPVLLQELTDETRLNMDHPQMISGRVVGRLLKILISISQAKNVLEIGTFTGYSALSMAEALPLDGKLTSLDINPNALAVARKYFDKSPDGKKIEITEGPALETIKRLSGPYDFIFIDADKSHYLEYYKAGLDLLKAGGLIVIDNALWSGLVLDPKDPLSKVIAETNDFILNDPRVENVLLTVRDGLNIVYKKILNPGTI